MNMKQTRLFFHQLSVGVFVIKSCGRLKDLILLGNAHALRQELSYFPRFTFTCGQRKTIQIRYVRTWIFSKSEKKTSVFKNIRIRVDITA